MKTDSCRDALYNRRSIRRFANESISDSDVEEIIWAGLQAPSAGNLQPWRIVVVRDKARMEKLAQAAFNQGFVAKGDLVLAVIAIPSESAVRYKERGSGLYVIQDTAALTYALLLATHCKGLGACWVGAFDESLAAKALNLPTGYRPVSLIPIGMPAEHPKSRGRKKLGEVVVKECF
ncbi:MAG: nitroreductase family protein [Candidatus Thorarchaeota archaeon]